MQYSVLLDIKGKERNCFFFPTPLTENDFFCNSSQINSIPSATLNYSDINKLGLFVLRDVITKEEEDRIVELLTQREWENLSHRRVQHFGYRFIYGSNNVNKNEKIAAIPDMIEAPIQKLIDYVKAMKAGAESLPSETEGIKPAESSPEKTEKKDAPIPVAETKPADDET